MAQFNSKHCRKLAKRHCLSLCFVIFALFSLLGWWESSRYSERHLVHIGPITLDTFSASSLLRISFVKNPSLLWGVKTNYRQPNKRGKFVMRPQRPTIRKPQSNIIELTSGYWHWIAASLLMAAILFVFELLRSRESRSSSR